MNFDVGLSELALHGSLLTHMTMITKVGASYNDHMNDDVLEVDTLFSTLFLRREPGTKVTLPLKLIRMVQKNIA